MPKHSMMDRLDGSEMEVWIKITRKKPYGWRVDSVNLKHLKKIAFEKAGRPYWDLITMTEPSKSHSVFDPLYETYYYLILKAYKREPIPNE